MVEKTDSRPFPATRGGHATANWLELYKRWRANEDEFSLADAYGLKPATVRRRCGWLDQHFPADAPARLRAGFTLRLERAKDALDSGEPQEAERQAKALMALIRAARALEDWCEPEPAAPAAPESAAPAAKETRGEGYDAGPELERRLVEHIRRARCSRAGGEPDAGPAAGGALGVQSLAGEREAEPATP